MQKALALQPNGPMLDLAVAEICNSFINLLLYSTISEA